MNNNSNQTYDFVCFTDLAYEFTAAEKKKIESKIKRRLKYYKLGAYNQGRVDYIRKFKEDLSSEISLATKSKYYQKSDSEFAALADFNTTAMVSEYSAKFSQIDKKEMEAMIDFALYLWYLR